MAGLPRRQFGKLSYSLVTVEGLKLLTNNPWCSSVQLSKIPSVVKLSCLKSAMIFVFSNFLVATNSLVRKHSIFVGASYKKN